MRSRVIRLALAAAAAAAAVAAPPADVAAAPQSAEWKYVWEDGAAAAEKLLDPLLKKYATPARCAELVKLLRKPPYAKGATDRETLDWTCPDGKTRQFTYILPKGYSPSKPAGVLVFLHGAVRQPAPGGGAGEAAQIAMPAVSDLDLIVVGPSTYDGVEWGDPACRALVHRAITFVKRNFNVDENRVFLAGDSDGGRGTYAVAETAAGALAAAVPVIGSPGGVTRFANLRNLPWFAINGEADSIFKIDHVRESVEGMRASGIDLTWKLVPKGAHDPFFFVKFKDEVCEFLRKHPRDPFPAVVHWTVDPSRNDRTDLYPADTCRWIRIDEAGASSNGTAFEDASSGLLQPGLARIEARRDGNRIDVRTSGVKAFTVLVAPEMADLAKPVEVRANGVLLFRGRVEADARVILEEARRLLDRTSVFVNRIRIDVDGPEVAAPAEPAPQPPAK